MKRLLWPIIALSMCLGCGPQQPKRAATKAEIRAMLGDKALEPVDITFKAMDTTPLHARIQHPKEGASSKIVIFAHQLCADHSEWADPAHDWVSALTAQGISTFALDLRGHGKSTTLADGSVHNLCDERDDDSINGQLRNMPMDVRSAISYVRANMEAKSIALVGSSIGANSALLAFGTDPKLKVVIALSPGKDYRGLVGGAGVAMSKGRNVVLVAAEDDEESAEAVREMVGMGEGVTSKVHATGGHGNKMLKANDGELERLVTILVDAL